MSKEDQTITDDEMIDMILHGSYPFVAKQAAQVAQTATARAAKLEQELGRIPALQECVEQLTRALEDKGARAYIFMGALWDIIAEDPNPTSGYGIAVVEIARTALKGETK